MSSKEPRTGKSKIKAVKVKKECPAGRTYVFFMA